MPGWRVADIASCKLQVNRKFAGVCGLPALRTCSMNTRDEFMTSPLATMSPYLPWHQGNTVQWPQAPSAGGRSAAQGCVHRRVHPCAAKAAYTHVRARREPSPTNPEGRPLPPPHPIPHGM